MKFCTQSELTRVTVLSCLKADLSKPQIKDLVPTNRSRVEAFVRDAEHALVVTCMCVNAGVCVSIQ